MKIQRAILALSFVIGLSACENNTKERKSVATDTENHSRYTDDMMKNMRGVPLTENIDVDYAQVMKVHHEGALQMAVLEAKDGSDDRLKALAQKMQETQKSEIEQLDKFLEDNKNAPKNYDPENKNEGFGKVLHKNMMMVMDAQGEMRGSTDQQFVKMMIPHHQTALYMAEGFLQYGKNEMLKSISRKMIQDQNEEIEELKNTEQAR